MRKFTTAERLKEIMNIRNMRQVDLLKAIQPYCKQYGIKLGKSALSQYVSGKVEPGQEKLTVLGLALRVSEAWLMGFDVQKERKETHTLNNLGDERTKEFVELFECLTLEQQILIVQQIKGILSNK